VLPIDFGWSGLKLVVRMSHNPNLRVGEDIQAPTRVRILASDTLVADALSAALSDIPGIEVVGAAEPAHVVLWDTGEARTRELDIDYV